MSELVGFKWLKESLKKWGYGSYVGVIAGAEFLEAQKGREVVRFDLVAGDDVDLDSARRHDVPNCRWVPVRMSMEDGSLSDVCRNRWCPVVDSPYCAGRGEWLTE